jgi:lipooligosaccharide transport system permease protein
LKFRRALSVWLRHYAVFRKLYKSSVSLNFIEPVLYLTAMGFGLGAFVREINGRPYVNFLAPGIVAYSSMFAATFECTYGTYIRLTYQKTFDAILATPVNIDDLVAGEIMWAASKSTLYGTIIIVVISLMGLVESPLLMAAIPVLFINGLVFAEISIIYTAVVPGIDYFNYYFTLFMTPMFLFSGIFFPLDGLPAIVEKLAFFTPLYHMVNVTRSLSDGVLPAADVLWLLVVASVLAPCAYWLMRRRILERAG